MACPTAEPPAPPRDGGVVVDGGARDAGSLRDGGTARDAGFDGGSRDGGVPVPTAALAYLGRRPLARPELTLRLTSDGVHAEISNDATFPPQRSLCAALTTTAPTCAAFAFAATATRTADPCDDTPGATNPCRYDVDWDLSVGVPEVCDRDDCERAVFARFVDAIGQTSTVARLDLVLDARAPDLATTVSYAPDVGVVFPTRDVATIGSTVTVTLVAHEPLEALPARLDAVEGTDALVLAQVPGSATDRGAAYAAVVTSAFAGANGTYRITSTLEDRAGNTRTVTASIAIAATPPVLLVDQDQVSYVRAPHVNLSDEDLGSFTIAGGPARYALAPLDELEDVDALPPDTFALVSGPAAAIRVFANGAPVSDWILPSANGAWARADLALAPSDAAYVDVVAIGPAELPSSPVRIARAWYVASSADAAASPHEFALGDAATGIGGAIVTSSVAAIDGAVVVHAPEATWVLGAERHNPPPPDFPSIVYDSSRDRLVMARMGREESVWEWDGTNWSDRTPSGLRPFSRQATAFAFDAARGEMVMFAGGVVPARSDTWSWDGARWTFHSPALVPPGRALHALAYDSTLQRVILFGGAIDFGLPQDPQTYGWDGANWSVLAPGGPIGSRNSHGMTYDEARQELVVYSGGELWTQSAGIWTLENPPGPRPATRYYADIAYDARREVVVLFGGSNFPQTFTDTWEWNGTTWTDVTPAGPSPSARDSASMTYHAGLERVALYSGFDGEQLDDLWLWDGTSWTEVTPIETGPVGVQGFAIHDVARQETVLFDRDQTWVWDGTSWTLVGTGPNFTIVDAVYDAVRDRVVAFGSVGNFMGTWEWDGNGWTPTTPASGSRPGAQGRSAAFDSARGVALVTGGSAETWTWDGTTWTDVTPPGTNPPARRSPALADDPIRGRVVLFGGEALSDTWEWDGVAWMQVVTPTAPVQGEMTYDLARREMILFGAERITPAPGRHNETRVWAYDGVDWTQRSIAGRPPRPRRPRTLTYDVARSRAFLHGGDDVGNIDPLDDTWEIALPADPRAELAASIPTNVPVASLANARVRASCGGHFEGSGATSDGAVLYVRTGTITTDLASHSTASPSVSMLSFAPSIASAASFAQSTVGADGRARFGCRANPTAATGGDGAVSVDYLEIRWRY